MSFKIVFMGTPEFSIPTLEALIKNKFNVVCVYTQPPTKSKRGQKINVSPIEEFSKKNKINFKNPTNLNSDEELNFFKELSPDIVVVVAYGQIIPKFFLNITKFGFINIHASLLPKWRGAAPIQRAIMNGDKKTGVSVMKIEEKLDIFIILNKDTNNTAMKIPVKGNLPLQPNQWTYSIADDNYQTGTFNPGETMTLNVNLNGEPQVSGTLLIALPNGVDNSYSFPSICSIQ